MLKIRRASKKPKKTNQPNKKNPKTLTYPPPQPQLKCPQTEKAKNKATKIISGMEIIVWGKTVTPLAFSVTETADSIWWPLQKHVRKMPEKESKGQY